MKGVPVSTSEAHVMYSVAERVARITLVGPEQRCVFTDRMEAELIDAIDDVDHDDEVAAVVLAGTGRTFCAGMELGRADDTFEAWRASPTAPPSTQYAVQGESLPVRRDGGGRVALRLFDCTKPLIAAINGDAIGVGITMTLPCDLRVMAEGARIAFPFTRRGFVPESCSSWFLPRLVPMQIAIEWMLTGRTLRSGDALSAGLVHGVYPADEVVDVATKMASDIVANSSAVSTSITRQMLWRMLTASHPMEAHRIETMALNLRGVSADAHEGIRAFLERRRPVFTDTPSTVAHDYFGALPQHVYASAEVLPPVRAH
ncbi:enoyl-CoA hydratase [Mycolicibacterium sp. (ex Dasyatis americana)]|nr:enoyl-CoA hydratase [Mycolicibacterium sp. (ex Dasyatis americana)]